MHMTLATFVFIQKVIMYVFIYFYFFTCLFTFRVEGIKTPLRESDGHFLDVFGEVVMCSDSHLVKL